MSAAGQWFVARVSSLRDQLMAWILNHIPFDWVLQRVVRWLAFMASAEQIRSLIALCRGAAPIAEGALQGAQLRETYARACLVGECSIKLQAEVEEATRFLDSATEQALQQLFSQLDANRDGKVSFAEALAAWDTATKPALGDGSGGDASRAVAALDPTAVALLSAMRRAEESMRELDKLKYSVSLAVEGAVAAVDEDGDGKISLDEVVQAPARVAGWLSVWKTLVERGKL